MSSGAAPVLAPGFVERPFWWDAAPPVLRDAEVPDEAEAAIIGGGIAGLSTALELARNGVRAVVLDREPIGWGGSSRNGGALAGGGRLCTRNAELSRRLTSSWARLWP